MWRKWQSPEKKLAQTKTKQNSLHKQESTMLSWKLNSLLKQQSTMFCENWSKLHSELANEPLTERGTKFQMSNEKWFLWFIRQLDIQKRTGTQLQCMWMSRTLSESHLLFWLLPPSHHHSTSSPRPHSDEGRLVCHWLETPSKHNDDLVAVTVRPRDCGKLSHGWCTQVVVRLIKTATTPKMK